MHEQGSYLFGDSDDREWETDVAGFGRVFPHTFGDGSSPYFTTWLTLSPAGDELVLDFAKKALVGEQLGARPGVGAGARSSCPRPCRRAVSGRRPRR